MINHEHICVQSHIHTNTHKQTKSFTLTHTNRKSRSIIIYPYAMNKKTINKIIQNPNTQALIHSLGQIEKYIKVTKNTNLNTNKK